VCKVWYCTGLSRQPAEHHHLHALLSCFGLPMPCAWTMPRTLRCAAAHAGCEKLLTWHRTLRSGRCKAANLKKDVAAKARRLLASVCRYLAAPGLGRSSRACGAVCIAVRQRRRQAGGQGRTSDQQRQSLPPRAVQAPSMPASSFVRQLSGVHAHVGHNCWQAEGARAQLNAVAIFVVDQADGPGSSLMAPSSKSGANCSMCGCSSCRWPVLLQKYWDAAYAAVQERELSITWAVSS